MNARPVVLVIAGVDSSGGAGLTRDVSVLADLDVDAVCAVTAVTAQSDSRVTAVHHVPPEIIRAQIAAAFEARPVAAVKIGMLGTRETVETVAASLQQHDIAPLVLDPVLMASSGGALLDSAGRKAMQNRLFPRATLITPNIPEAGALLNEEPASSEEALIYQARRLLDLGPEAVLLKGGHAAGERAVDYLVHGNRTAQRLTAPRIQATRRGTGCALASAVAAGLVSGMPLAQACQRAKEYVNHMFRDISVSNS